MYVPGQSLAETRSKIHGFIPGRENWSDFIHKAHYAPLENGGLRVENTVMLGNDIVDISSPCDAPVLLYTPMKWDFEYYEVPSL